jgi:hypothetical protein
LITDRPDFTESSAAVSPWHVQAEFGTSFDVGDRDWSIEFPALLLRVGVVKNIELRLGAPVVSLAKQATPDVDMETELGDLELGVKLVLPFGEESAVGLLPFVTLPVMTGDYDSRGVGVGLRGVWSTELSSRLSLGGNLGVLFSGIGAEEQSVEPEYIASLSLGISLTDRLGTFVESYGIFSERSAQPVLNTGLTYLLLPNLQLDAHAGLGLNDVRGYLGAGASVLW